MNKVRTIQAKAAEKIARAASRHGVEPGTLYRSVGLNPALLDDPDVRVRAIREKIHWSSEFAQF